jgi:hypothetical protein
MNKEMVEPKTWETFLYSKVLAKKSVTVLNRLAPAYQLAERSSPL